MADFGDILNTDIITDGSVHFTDAGTLAEDNTNFTWDNINKSLTVGSPTSILNGLPENALNVNGDFGGLGSPDFLAISNHNSNPYGSTDHIVSNDLDDGTVLTGTYGDFGIAGSTYATTGDAFDQPNDVYLLSSFGAGNLNIVAQGTGKTINFGTAGDTVDQKRATIADNKMTIFANKDVELITTPLVGGDWTATGGWSVTAGELVLVSNAGPNTIQPSTPLTITPGLTYYIVIEASAASGTISYTIGGRTGTAITTGTTVDFLTATTNDNLVITGLPTNTATITGVSVRALIPNTGTLEVQGGLVLGGGITKTSGFQVMNIDGDSVVTFAQIPFVPVALPTQDYQVANKFYVDTFSQGLVPYLDIQLLSTLADGNITLVGSQSIDGVSTSSGTDVALNFQTLPAQNGIYTTAAGAWSRRADFDSTAEVKMGAFFYVTSGSTNAGKRIAQYLFNPASDTLGVDPIGFTTISQAGFGVTSVSVVSANGFSGSVANPSTTPAITMSTTVTGLLRGNGSALLPTTIGTGLTFTGGTLSVTTGAFANVNLSNLVTTAVNADILPGVDNTINLGNSTHKWASIYAGLNGILSTGNIQTVRPASGSAFGLALGQGAASGGTGGQVTAGDGYVGGLGGWVRAGDAHGTGNGGDVIAGTAQGASGTGGTVWSGDSANGSGGPFIAGSALGANGSAGDFVGGTGAGSGRSSAFITDATGFFTGGKVNLLGSTSGTFTMQPAAVTTSYTIKFPAAQGSGSLTNDGAGNLTWVPGGGGGSPGGSNTQVQYNNSGAFGGITGATSNGTTLTLTSGRAVTDFSPSTNGGAALGTTALEWSNLFLASGAVINFNNSNITLTHAAFKLTLAGGTFNAAGGTYIDNLGTHMGTDATGLTGTFGANTVASGTGVAGYTLLGATTSFFSWMNPGTTTLGANNSHARFILANSVSLAEAASGVHPLIAHLAIKPLSITNGVATTTNAATLYIEGAATGTAVVTNNYALWVAGGTSRFDGAVLSTSTGGVGYAVGAGGAVTQLTNKSTGVTLNKICGQITMNAAALAATTTVSFILSNNTIAITDTIIVNIGSVGTVGSYEIWVSAVGTGSCTISLRNISAGSLSQAVVLNYAVIKTVNA